MALISTSKTTVAAENYTGGDVVSESVTAGTAWRFRGIENRAGMGSVLQSAVLTCDEDSVTATYRLHFFNADPADSELNDNIAFSVVAADQAKYIGFVDFGAMVDRGVISTAVALNVQLHLVSGDTGSSIYGILQDTSGETAETAGMVMTITLGVSPQGLM